MQKPESWTYRNDRMKRQKRLPIAGKNIENFFSSAENIFLVAKVRTFIEKEKSIWSKFKKFYYEDYIVELQALTNRKEKYDRSKTCFIAIKSSTFVPKMLPVSN